MGLSRGHRRAGVVCLWAEQVVAAHAKEAAELEHIFCVRHGLVQLPSADCLPGYAELGGELFLREAALAAQELQLFPEIYG